MTQEEQWKGENRRKIPRANDKFYQVVVGINLFAWVVFIASLVLFHYARPELISGVQAYWGMEGRQDWSETLSFYLIVLLSVCAFLGITVLLMKRQRSRRKNDYFGVNIVALLVISVATLLWILSAMAN